MKDIHIHPVNIGRVTAWRDENSDIEAPEHLFCQLDASYSIEGLPDHLSAGIKATTLIAGEHAEQPLRSLERLADEALPDVLEAIASELRRRAKS